MTALQGTNRSLQSVVAFPCLPPAASVCSLRRSGATEGTLPPTASANRLSDWIFNRTNRVVKATCAHHAGHVAVKHWMLFAVIIGKSMIYHVFF